jgi:dTDP-glucose 4,6-dehydratase
MTRLDPVDLDHILKQTGDLWDELRGKRIFITGGTGFFGCWLLESFLWANRQLNLRASIVVLTRNPDQFRRKAPHLVADPCLSLLVGDVRDFQLPAGEFTFLIHAATEASIQQMREAPFEMLDTIVSGTRHALEFARRCGIQKVLFTSSGAVYGRQPSSLDHVPEDYLGGPDPLNPTSVYGEGKRTAEMLCALYASKYSLDCKIARCFAFVGPYLPLDSHFAIGNFIRDGLSGGPVRVTGDGTAYRSYLYAADLAIWLWTILLRGVSCRPYNVGSEADLTISDLARKVAGLVGGDNEIQMARHSTGVGLPERYVPDTRRAQFELGLREWTSFNDAILSTARWYAGASALPAL